MDSANQDQIEFWNRLGQRWVEIKKALVASGTRLVTRRSFCRACCASLGIIF
jgi:hypothetical protein